MDLELAGVISIDDVVLLRHILIVVVKKMELEPIIVIVRVGREHIPARSGSFSFVSILMSSKCLRSAELTGTIEAREHSR